jgi:hypothetical protein
MRIDGGETRYDWRELLIEHCLRDLGRRSNRSSKKRKGAKPQRSERGWETVRVHDIENIV